MKWNENDAGWRNEMKLMLIGEMNEMDAGWRDE